MLGSSEFGTIAQALFENFTQPAFQADLVLLHIGTNDVWAWRSGVAIAADLADLLSGLYAVWPRTRVLLSTLLYPNVGQDANWRAYNAAMPAMVSALQQRGMLISMFDGASIAGMCPPSKVNSLCCLADDVHPSGRGYAAFADAWFNAMIGFVPPSVKP